MIARQMYVVNGVTVFTGRGVTVFTCRKIVVTNGAHERGGTITFAQNCHFSRERETDALSQCIGIGKPTVLDLVAVPRRLIISQKNQCLVVIDTQQRSQFIGNSFQAVFQ